MNLQAPPELADGGYWYAVKLDPAVDGQFPLISGGAGWCAWYGSVAGTVYAAVRCPSPVDSVDQATTVSPTDVLMASGDTAKPYGRVGGS